MGSFFRKKWNSGKFSVVKKSVQKKWNGFSIRHNFVKTFLQEKRLGCRKWARALQIQLISYLPILQNFFFNVVQNHFSTRQKKKENHENISERFSWFWNLDFWVRFSDNLEFRKIFCSEKYFSTKKVKWIFDLAQLCQNCCKQK